MFHVKHKIKYDKIVSRETIFASDKNFVITNRFLCFTRKDKCFMWNNYLKINYDINIIYYLNKSLVNKDIGIYVYLFSFSILQWY